MVNITESLKSLLKKAAKALSGFKRREFEAEVTNEYFDGSPYKAERIMGWDRETVKKGQKELETGIRCIDNYKMRGNKKIEDKNPQLIDDILELVEPKSQVDPQFKNSFIYTRITGEGVLRELIEKKGYKEEDLPCVRTIRNILNRQGYKMRRVQKSKPQKKIPEVDMIFENVWRENAQSDMNKNSLRISIDTKDKVKIGEFSRGGKSRGQEAKKAGDHDMDVLARLVPVGILDVVSGESTIIFGTAVETSDLIVDSLELWWDRDKCKYEYIDELVINIDNGPQVGSSRTQFIKRMVEFADKTGLRIRLVYYPPYHSKYNPIEHVWGVLEKHWNGTILDKIETAIEWASTMTWRGIKPIVHYIKDVYEKGVRVAKKEMKYYEARIKRAAILAKWDVTIEPVLG